jgi:hypothetical protein
MQDITLSKVFDNAVKVPIILTPVIIGMRSRTKQENGTKTTHAYA